MGIKIKDKSGIQMVENSLIVEWSIIQAMVLIMDLLNTGQRYRYLNGHNLSFSLDPFTYEHNLFVYINQSRLN